MPANTAFALALTNNPSEVIDMPVDPNEPVYCICQQVSYGEMVACDNRQCPIEWFHFECVGLKETPKGTWFCPKCREENEKDVDVTVTPVRNRSVKVNKQFLSPLTNRLRSPKLKANEKECKEPEIDHNEEIKRLRNEIDETILQIKHHRKTNSQIHNIQNSEDVHIDEDLKTWRERMHNYNESKDTCLELFNHLSDLRSCTIKELYTSFGLSKDD